MSWTPDLRDAEGPIYLAIADAIGRAVAAGELLDGMRLPTQRELAKRLGIDLTTVTRAYAEAQRSGHIVGDGRRGSYVRGRVSRTPGLSILATQGLSPSTSGLDHLDVAALEAPAMNAPPEPQDGVLQAAVAQALEAILLRQGRLPHHYQPSGGAAFDRAVRAEMLSATGPTQADQVVITAGAQNAIHAICSAVLRPGQRIACGQYAYPGLLAIARRIGAEVVPVEMDAEGLIPEALETTLQAGPITVLFVVPTNDNPTTATLPAARRNAIGELAERHGFWIIEDDVYGAASNPAALPIASYAPLRTWYVTSVSKSVTPGLRVGTVRAPTVRHAFELAADIEETSVMAPPLSVAISTQWLLDGALPALIEAVGREATARQKIAAEVLVGRAFHVAPRGSHLWLPRPDAPPGPEALASGALANLPVAPAGLFAARPTGMEQSLRVSLGGLRSRARLTSDLSRLDAALALADRRRG